MTITSFFEDRAQKEFLTALVTRIAGDVGINASNLVHDVRADDRGSGLLPRLELFARQNPAELLGGDRILLISLDGNCKGPNDRIKGVFKECRSLKSLKTSLQDRLVFAIPDPHIERWYLADQRAFNEVVGSAAAPEMPRHKCERGFYKQLLWDRIAAANISTWAAGPEFGTAIAEKIDFKAIERVDRKGFKKFADDLRRAFRRVQSTSDL